jgi:hypothetical protein
VAMAPIPLCPKFAICMDMRCLACRCTRLRVAGSISSWRAISTCSRSSSSRVIGELPCRTLLVSSCGTTEQLIYDCIVKQLITIADIPVQCTALCQMLRPIK